MTGSKTLLQNNPKQVICVLFILFLVLLALSIWVWNLPNKTVTAFTALRGEVLDLQTPSMYPLDTLPTPEYPTPSDTTIPRIVHYVVFDDVNKPPNANWSLCAAWEHRRYTNKQQQDFIATTFGQTWPDIVHAYNLCRLTEIQVCLFKYLVVYHHGGLYVDSNAVSLKPFDTLTSNDKAVVAPCTPPMNVDLLGDMTNKKGEYQSWWVMAPPKSKFLWQVVWQVVRNIFALHAKGSSQCNFADLSSRIADSAAGRVCYTYIASKFKHYVSVHDNDFLSLKHNVPARITNTYVGIPNHHLGDLPMHLVYVQDHKATAARLTKHKIPPIIHQTHKSRWVTPAMARAMQTIRDHAPNCEYRFYDDADSRKFIQNHYPSALNAYDSLIPGAFRADLLRAIVVYTLGGIYFDSGTSPMPDIDLFTNVLRESDTFVIPIDAPNNGLYNAFFAATQHNPYVQTIIEHILDNIDTKQMFLSNPSGFLQITGPLAYKDALVNSGAIPNMLTKSTACSAARLLWFTGQPGEVIMCSKIPLYNHRYPEYDAQRFVINGGKSHYATLWKQNKVYRGGLEPCLPHTKDALPIYNTSLCVNAPLISRCDLQEYIELGLPLWSNGMQAYAHNKLEAQVWRSNCAYYKRCSRNHTIHFVLISDDTFPTDYLPQSVQNIYKSATHVYAQNLDRSQLSDQQNSVTTAVPIGLDLHTVSEKEMWQVKQTSTYDQFTLLKSLRFEAPHLTNRIRKVLITWLPNSTTSERFVKHGYKSRPELYKECISNPECTLGTGSRDQTWETMSKHAFVYSPIGNGFDCHRTWEALALGCIVIAQTNPTLATILVEHPNLPIWFCDNPSTLNTSLLDTLIAQFDSAKLHELSMPSFVRHM